jgi:hypothetical protein
LVVDRFAVELARPLGLFELEREDVFARPFELLEVEPEDALRRVPVDFFCWVWAILTLLSVGILPTGSRTRDHQRKTRVLQPGLLLLVRLVPEHSVNDSRGRNADRCGNDSGTGR